MSVLIKGLNIKPCKDGFDGKGLVIIGYDDKLYAVAHEQIIPLPDHGDLIDKSGGERIMDDNALKIVFTDGDERVIENVRSKRFDDGLQQLMVWDEDGYSYWFPYSTIKYLKWGRKC